MTSIKANQTTPYQQVLDSKPVKFAKDNKIVTAGALSGAAITLKYAADSSPITGTIVKKGLVPVVGAGLATLGGLMVHDALANAKDTIETHKHGKAQVALQAGGGAALTLAGTEIIGHSLNIHALKPVTNAAKFLARNPNIVGSGLYMAAGGVGAKFAVDSMVEKGVTAGNGLGLAASVAGTTLGGALMTMEIAGVGAKATDIAFKLSGGLSGAALGVATVGLAKTAYEGIQEKDNTKAMLAGVGAATTGTVAIHLMGNATGIKALSNLGQKIFASKPLLSGAIAATAIGVGAYLMYSNDEVEKEAAKTTKPASK